MTHETKTEDDLCRQCDRTGNTQPGTAIGRDHHHDDGGYAVPCTVCGKAALRTDWETIDGGSVNFHWREVCAHCGHVSESLFA
ncbi:hypothetical protein [Mameliella alba]|uniref:Uncharacterized protein n=1 Tax=Mameliella alba TaxID=561184 RepID=A0A0B3RFF3_9RHOB|nr:hypothetical protein [Mameliella alba]KHQ49940.1 hypothetical protein OA50_05517 [Mameliella alba]